MNRSRIKKVTASVLPWVVIFSVGWFFYATLSENWHQLDGAALRFDVWAALGVVSFVLAVVISGVLWGGLLSTIEGRPVSVSDSIRIHCASWLLKYIPGQVGSYINKLAWGSKNSFSKRSISTSFIYENILMVVAGAALSVPVLLVFGHRFDTDLGVFVPLLMIIPMLVVFSRPIFRWVLNKLTGLVKKSSFREKDFLSTGKLMAFQAGYLVPRLLNGVGFLFIAGSMLQVEPHMYVGLAAAYVLASIVGLLAIFVPGGLGVREAVLVLFVSVYFPVEQAIILSVITRLYATLSDVGVALVYFVLNKGRIRQL